ncbi:IspD/TarI family cytidylyltransferase [Spiroplasma endosymbiont of Amphibalanus improvisus]|uniref:IspD/TarI family cytidylyltransferase n=1 Tax=Spiroplasma endosymbiont of Amphibalanus improvisus TaxID=3066327 RepID=UPI00313D6F13
MNYSVIIVAAGQGKRFGFQNKLLLKIGEQTVIEKSISVFLQDPNCQKIIIGVSKTISEFLENKIKNLTKPVLLVEGGQTRAHTVLSCIKKVKTGNYLLIHDGARPFINLEFIHKILEPLKSYEGVIPGIKPSDTVKKITTSNLVSQTLNRDDLMLIQTPQAFHFNKIEEAYYRWSDNDLHNVNDDSQILENYSDNCYIKIIEGNPKNIKITFPSDFKS